MALQTNIDTPYGTAATYWRITRVSVDLKANAVEFELEGYINADARKNASQGLAMRRFGCVLPGVPEQFGRAEMYAVVRGQPDFTDAKDI